MTIPYGLYQVALETTYHANDIVECTGKFEEAGWKFPTEQSQPVLVSQYAFAIEPGAVYLSQIILLVCKNINHTKCLCTRNENMSVI